MSGISSKANDEVIGLCSNCGAIASLKCSNCKSSFYCKRECQKEDWIKGHKEVCRAVKVKSNSVLGRYLVATRAFKAGDVIFKETPLVVGPKQITTPICLGCYKKVNGKYRCSKCTWPLCGPECEAREDHRPECNVGREIGSVIDIADFSNTNHFYEVVMPLRCIALKRISPKKYSDLLSLESHYKERKGSHDYKDNKDKIVNMLRNYFMIVDFPRNQIDSSEDNIEKMIGILNTNTIDVPMIDEDICGLYSIISIIEHSCIPNVKILFNDQKNAVVKAAVDIKPGDHLVISYTNIIWGTMVRREYLKLNKFFMCTCKRCADPFELGSNISSLKCQECKTGYMTSAAPLDELANWICSNCNCVLSPEIIKKITMEIGEVFESALLSPTINTLENLIEKYKSILHPNHFHFFVLKHTLMQMYGKGETLDENSRRMKEKLAKESLKICTILDPGMAKLNTYAAMALYEYHIAIMARSNEVDSMPNPEVIKSDIGIAKSLLVQCAKLLQDESEYGPKNGIREIALKNLQELNDMIFQTGN